jgi:adenylosuccinate lyase
MVWKIIRLIISILYHFVFSEEDSNRIKELEKVTNHDIKAVEYFIKEKLDAIGLSSIKEWVHFGLTSQDINNTAFPLMIRDAWIHVLVDH